MNLQPISDKIVLVREESTNKSKGGIILTVEEKINRGTVVAVGQGKYDTETGERVPLITQVGDKIIFNETAAVEADLDDGEYIVIIEDSVIGIIK